MTRVVHPRAHTFQAFGGAECEVVTVDAGDDDLAELVAEVEAFERRLSRFDPHSELCALNGSAGVPFEPTPLLKALLLSALDAYELSEGLVNAAAHDALVRAGYDRTFPELRVSSRLVAGRSPMPVAPLPAVLEVGPQAVRLAPGHRIDLGGVGKGWLADRLAERFDNAVVNLGGDVAAHGDGPYGCGWVVGMCDGRTVAVTNAGVATSGTAGRRWTGGHHLIDPRTGLPAATDVEAISVVAGSAFLAEVMAKSAAVLGADQGTRWLRARGLVSSVVTS